MNSLTALLEQFSLPELTKVLRYTALSAVAVGVVALVVAALLQAVIFGWGVCLGLALGLANIRLVTLQTAHVSERKVPKPIRALASLTLARLAVTTAIIVALAAFVTSLGLGAVAGIAVFYGIFLVSLIVSILRHRSVTA